MLDIVIVYCRLTRFIEARDACFPKNPYKGGGEKELGRRAEITKAVERNTTTLVSRREWNTCS
jgi:hypothetical protein